MLNDTPEEPTMKLYSAADLHSNNHFLTIIDEQDRRILEKRGGSGNSDRVSEPISGRIC